MKPRREALYTGKMAVTVVFGKAISGQDRARIDLKIEQTSLRAFREYNAGPCPLEGDHHRRARISAASQCTTYSCTNFECLPIAVSIPKKRIGVGIGSPSGIFRRWRYSRCRSARARGGYRSVCDR